MNQPKKDLPSEVSERLVLAIRKIGLSKTELGSQIGANKDTIGRAVRSGKISKTILAGLATKFNVNPKWLLEGEGTMMVNEALDLSSLTNEWKDKYISCLEENSRLQAELLSLKSRISASQ